MLSFRDIYITLSSSGVPALVRWHSHRGPSLSLFHFSSFLHSIPFPPTNENAIIVTTSKDMLQQLKQTGIDRRGWVYTCGGLLCQKPCDLMCFENTVNVFCEKTCCDCNTHVSWKLCFSLYPSRTDVMMWSEAEYTLYSIFPSMCCIVILI